VVNCTLREPKTVGPYVGGKARHVSAVTCLLRLRSSNGYFCLWGWDGTLEKIHHVLYVKCREQAEREASPTACVIDRWGVAAS
jgi:hypothetical protein